MIEIQASKLLTLADATKRVPGRNGKRLDPSTIWRWCRIGIKSRSGDRIRLEHVRVGGRVFTTDDALSEFFARVAEADLAHFAAETVSPAQQPTHGQRRRSIERSEQTLRGAGIL